MEDTLLSLSAPKQAAKTPFFKGSLKSIPSTKFSEDDLPEELRSSPLAGGVTTKILVRPAEPGAKEALSKVGVDDDEEEELEGLPDGHPLESEEHAKEAVAKDSDYRRGQRFKRMTRMLMSEATMKKFKSFK